MNPDELDDYGFDYEDEEADEDDCGYDADYPGVCWHVGTEHCSFWCPFHRVYFEED